MPIMVMMEALGKNTKDILKYYYKIYEIGIEEGYVVLDKNILDGFLDKVIRTNIVDDKNNVVVSGGSSITKDVLENIKTLDKIKVDDSFFADYDVVLYADVAIGKSDKLDVLDKIDSNKVNILRENKVKKIEAIIPFTSDIFDYICEELRKYNKNKSKLAGKVEYAKRTLSDVFFSDTNYFLSESGRIKINSKLGGNETSMHLTERDILESIRYLLNIKCGNKKPDDIDSLCNRLVKTSGRIVERQFESGISKLSRNILERINSTTISSDSLVPQALVNSKIVSSAINDFFATSQLSQFMDSTNPLSEISHKRRITLLGPGGMARGGIPVSSRGIQMTSYNKICPIETPEGQNIGVVSNFSLYSDVDKNGFIVTPYKVVKDGVITDDIKFLSANDEEGKNICINTGINVDKNGKIGDDMVACIVNDVASGDLNFDMLDSNLVDYMSISMKQVVSVSANLIPFVANDEGKRALMASAMMRQAVPCVGIDSPFVGTGIESKVAIDSGAIILSKKDGIVRSVDSKEIVVENIEIEGDKSDFDIYELDKFVRTNSGTSINQVPIVKVGQEVKAGQRLTDTQVVKDGDLSLGRNILVAFLPFDGYNFADSIVISDKLIKDGMYTSVHIEEFEVVARDTKIGPEEITRDVPDVSNEMLRKIDESGIIHIGAEVKSGDILVGKTTPKFDSPETAEEKLLRNIFGEKISNVKDSSLYLPAGVLSGKVIDVKVFTRPGVEESDREKSIKQQKKSSIYRKRDNVLSLIKASYRNKLIKLASGCVLERSAGDIKKGAKVSSTDLRALKDDVLFKISVADKNVMEEIEVINQELKSKEEQIAKKINREIDIIDGGVELPNGVLRIVKVLVASKQVLSVGDKMAGRHGNKGVISRIVPSIDMPYMKNGRPIDMILTPSGVPSRMSIGQVLEVHLGMAAVNFGEQIKKILKIEEEKEKADNLREELLLIFDLKEEQEKIKSMSDDEIINLSEKYKNGVLFSVGVFDKVDTGAVFDILMKSCSNYNPNDIDSSGQVDLYDGRTGEKFDRKVTVGYMYMLKLHHLVDTKIHARSIGPYSLITQQPLSGKSHFGGQRFGEMECWALEGYGAAYTLQEMLTVKSDDMYGRVKMYENIVQGSQGFVCGIPETFNVMVRELRGLSLNLELIKDDK
ncbi:MAG: DNA-directed RNA polymerase subunit beta [Rickettsiales bacterium]|jgi:DNA-directed RNA polymerase subunit beta|nr:DNA-directed RNA polymerase subunit beta [Rickettsiales bacterium]